MDAQRARARHCRRRPPHAQPVPVDDSAANAARGDGPPPPRRARHCRHEHYRPRGRWCHRRQRREAQEFAGDGHVAAAVPSSSTVLHEQLVPVDDSGKGVTTRRSTRRFQWAPPPTRRPITRSYHLDRASKPDAQSRQWTEPPGGARTAPPRCAAPHCPPDARAAARQAATPARPPRRQARPPSGRLATAAVARAPAPRVDGARRRQRVKTRRFEAMDT